jgi:hypothetical protein
LYSLLFIHHSTSKSTPVPIPRHTQRHLGSSLRSPIRTRRERARRNLSAVLSSSSTSLLVGPGAAGARILAIRPAPPLLELAVAVGACADRCPARVVVCVLVEGDFVGAVVVAEDVAAAPAVVAAREVGKGLAAGGVVADCGLVVGLFEEKLLMPGLVRVIRRD